MNRPLLHRLAPVVVGALGIVDRRVPESTRPFRRTRLFRPHTRSRLWGWTHYGVFLPDLPEPHRYLNTMTFIGATGTVCFDNDHLAARDVRDTATVLSATAHADQHHYRAYDSGTDCAFGERTGHLAWGENLAIELALPAVTVRGRYERFAVDLELTTGDTVAWFVRTAAYDHLSLLASYRGTITDAAGEHEIGGLGTVEYARCVSPQTASATPLAEHRKLPVDFFTYQIVNLGADTQLLLTDVRAAGASACRLAQLRTRDGRTQVFEQTRCTVAEYLPEPLTDPIGRTMRAPRRMRWTIGPSNDPVIAIEATVDSPYRFGHGRGYVAAFTHYTTWSGHTSTGTGYLEWIDCT
ncbi:DUF6670 family protein [Sciscionella marina]|uniref:DUF6670 family protein n=1 Tax=Sciscionella marina TaxID=508770 RepID=UPI0006851DC1|nr:DUF6670 family protein [Sciscionella marina]